MGRAKEEKMTGPALQDALWDTLEKIRAGDMTPQQGDAIAIQAREITRTMRTRLSVLRAANEVVAGDLVDFAKGV